ncbi:MAG: hypothetical protein ACXVHN_03240 [Methanobacterium sp.]
MRDATVRKCKKVTIIMDKKMREHRIEHKYIKILISNILLNE